MRNERDLHLNSSPQVLHHMCYNELRVAPEEHSVLITEPLFTDLLAREKITQLLFETFTVEGV